jgi:hypothetical protein
MEGIEYGSNCHGERTMRDADALRKLDRQRSGDLIVASLRKK